MDAPRRRKADIPQFSGFQWTHAFRRPQFQHKQHKESLTKPKVKKTVTWIWKNKEGYKLRLTRWRFLSRYGSSDTLLKETWCRSRKGVHRHFPPRNPGNLFKWICEAWIHIYNFHVKYDTSELKLDLLLHNLMPFKLNWTPSKSNRMASILNFSY